MVKITTTSDLKTRRTYVGTLLGTNKVPYKEYLYKVSRRERRREEEVSKQGFVRERMDGGIGSTKSINIIRKKTIIVKKRIFDSTEG